MRFSVTADVEDTNTLTLVPTSSSIDKYDAHIQLRESLSGFARSTLLLVCPSCDRPGRRLYLHNPDESSFRCRRCLNLRHRSQTLAKENLAVRRWRKAASRVSLVASPEEPDLRRPRYMHRRTYKAASDEISAARRQLATREYQALLAADAMLQRQEWRHKLANGFGSASLAEYWSAFDSGHERWRLITSVDTQNRPYVDT